MVGSTNQILPAIGNAPQNIEQLQALETQALSELAARFPYVPLYKILLAKRLKAAGGDDYRDMLRRAALQAPDRVRLYEILQHPEEAPAGIDGIIAETGIPAVEPETEEQSAPAIETSIDVSADAVVEDDPVAGPEAGLPVAENEKIEAEERQSIDNAAVPEEPARQQSPQAPPPELLRTAAQRGVTLEEKHTFLEWLELLEGGSTEPEKEDGERVPAPEMITEDAVGVLEDQIDEYSASQQYEADIQREASEMEEHETEEPLPEAESAAVKDLADRSIALTTGIVTETLAKLMLMQGKKKESIAMYEQLRLKYPEKSDYFAAQIQAIKAS